MYIFCDVFLVIFLHPSRQPLPHFSSCSDPDKSILLPCSVVFVSPAWILVSTSSNAWLGAAASLAVDLPFALWDNTTLVVSRSFDTVLCVLEFLIRPSGQSYLYVFFVFIPLRQLYSYATSPVITGVSGCGPPRQDSDTNFVVSTVDCPTVGGFNMTIAGFFFGFPGLIPPTIVIGLAQTFGNIIPSAAGANQSVVTFVLPPGISADLNVTVHICAIRLLFTSIQFRLITLTR